MKTNWHYDLEKVKDWAKSNGMSIIKQDPPCGLDIANIQNDAVLSICNDYPTILVFCNLNNIRRVTKLAKSLHRYCKVRR